MRIFFLYSSFLWHSATSEFGTQIFYQTEETFENVIHGTGYVTIALFLDASQCDESCDQARKAWKAMMLKFREDEEVNIIWIGIFYSIKLVVLH